MILHKEKWTFKYRQHIAFAWLNQLKNPRAERREKNCETKLKYHFSFLIFKGNGCRISPADFYFIMITLPIRNSIVTRYLTNSSNAHLQE